MRRLAWAAVALGVLAAGAGVYFLKPVNGPARDLTLSPEARLEARQKLAALPRNSSPVRLRTRCQVSGRPRAVYKKFMLSRIAFRELALAGHLPGVHKASW